MAAADGGRQEKKSRHGGWWSKQRRLPAVGRLTFDARRKTGCGSCCGGGGFAQRPFSRGAVGRATIDTPPLRLHVLPPVSAVHLHSHHHRSRLPDGNRDASLARWRTLGCAMFQYCSVHLRGSLKTACASHNRDTWARSWKRAVSLERSRTSQSLTTAAADTSQAGLRGLVGVDGLSGRWVDGLQRHVVCQCEATPSSSRLWRAARATGPRCSQDPDAGRPGALRRMPFFSTSSVGRRAQNMFSTWSRCGRALSTAFHAAANQSAAIAAMPPVLKASRPDHVSPAPLRPASPRNSPMSSALAVSRWDWPSQYLSLCYF